MAAGKREGAPIYFSDMVSYMDKMVGKIVAKLDELKVDGRSFLPQLNGQSGDPREWIYGWYARDGKTDIKEWVRDKHYKLYRSGEFYELSRDLYESSPLQEEHLTPEAQNARAKLMEPLRSIKIKVQWANYKSIFTKFDSSFFNEKYLNA